MFYFFSGIGYLKCFVLVYGMFKYFVIVLFVCSDIIDLLMGLNVVLMIVEVIIDI